jgi:hypothetical protein
VSLDSEAGLRGQKSAWCGGARLCAIAGCCSLVTEGSLKAERGSARSMVPAPRSDRLRTDTGPTSLIVTVKMMIVIRVNDNHDDGDTSAYTCHEWKRPVAICWVLAAMVV